MQILEGEKDEVKKLYEKIKNDDRHDSVILLSENYVQETYFHEWSMAYYEPAEKNIRHFVHSLITMAELSDKSTLSLKTFWAEVRKVLLGG